MSGFDSKKAVTRFKRSAKVCDMYETEVPSNSTEKVCLTTECCSTMNGDETRTNERQDNIYSIELTNEASGIGNSRKLGVIKLPIRASLSCARTTIVVNIRYLPISFIFLTKNGYPITKDHEKQFTCTEICDEANVIRIQKNFEKPRIGIQDLQNNDYGFIFIDHTCGLSALRAAIQKELSVPVNFCFKDANNWLVVRDHEDKLVVLDVLQGAVVRITETFPASNRKRPISAPRSTPRPAAPTLPHIDPEEGHVSDDCKDILISYVRSEAAESALKLKTALIERNFTVYLDVHEIKPGIDWQDSLNNAVTHCQLFVPLITKKYGETRWTNREVKLADVLRKQILPINFLSHWPPQHLAIQFATTQYVSYRPDLVVKGTADTQSVFGEVVSPSSCQENAAIIECAKWTPEHVEFVAERIKVALQKFNRDEVSKKIKTSLTRQPSHLKSYPKTSRLPRDIGYEVRSNREGKPLVVISLHPEKKSFGENLSEILMKIGVDVWLSTSSISTKNDVGIDLSTEATQKLPNSDFFSPSQNINYDGRIKSNHIFQDKANEAGCIIILLSKAFARSSTSKSQVYYCEHRKRLIPIICDEFEMPVWVTRLVNSRLFIDAKTKNFKETLTQKVKKAVRYSGRYVWIDDVEEEKISFAANQLKKLMPKGYTIYITGSTKTDDETRNICRVIGQHLATLEGVHIITGGLQGVGDHIACEVFEERTKKNVIHNVWHVLPDKDDSSYSSLTNQNEDGTFEERSYGNTFFFGDSFQEREAIVSRVFDSCILLGGNNTVLREIEQFVWSEKVVLPIKKLGGAAFCTDSVSPQIFDLPVSVCSEDWTTILDEKSSPNVIGKSIVKIVQGLQKQHCIEEAPSQFATTPFETPLTAKRGFFSQNTLE